MNFTFLKILAKKEFAQIAKDRSALVIAFLMPLILVVIYGYAMRMDIKPVKVGFVSDLGSKIERDLLGGFLGSKYLQTRVYTDLESARRDFRAHEIESILYFDPRFAAKFQRLGGASGVNLNLSSDESPSAGSASDIQNTSGGVNASPSANDVGGAGGAGGASGSNKDGAEIFLIQNATQSQLALLSYVYVAGVIEQVLAQDYGFLNANLNAAAKPVSVRQTNSRFFKITIGLTLQSISASSSALRLAVRPACAASRHMIAKGLLGRFLSVRSMRTARSFIASQTI